MSKNAEHAAIMFGVILHHSLAPAAELSQTGTVCASRNGNGWCLNLNFMPYFPRNHSNLCNFHCVEF
jgi:hypothetical protein